MGGIIIHIYFILISINNGIYRSNKKEKTLLRRDKKL